MNQNQIILKLIVISMFCIAVNHGIAQQNKVEKIRHELSVATGDTTRINLLIDLCDEYKYTRPDSAIYYGKKAVSLSKKINYPKGEVNALAYVVLAHHAIGNEAKALEIVLYALHIAEKNNLNYEEAAFYMLLGHIYRKSHNHEKALSLYRQSMMIFDSLQNTHFSAMTRSDIGETYFFMDKLDSAQFYAQLAFDLAVQHKSQAIQYYSLPTLGKIHHIKGNDNLALNCFWKCLEIDYKNYLYLNPNLAIARFYQQTNNPDSSLFYAKQSLDIALENGFYSNIVEAGMFISKFYEETNPVEALKYLTITTTYKDSLYNVGKLTALEHFTDFDEQERQREIEDAKADFQNRIRMNAFLGITFTLLVIAFFLYRNNRNKQKAKQNIEKAYLELGKAHETLKSTQSQLIQSEKMASLGELTAGIAHEIQNPLNFVNNFSEVSNELIDEMKEEQAAGNLQLANEIADDIKQNLEKINHHGKRAADIVKGMLQHSRTSSGQKEPTDINALADEYLRLAYHGLRAKDKTFNADFKTEFDESLPKINVIPQDIGRVLLNLINNAFYAVSERAKLLTPPPPEGGSKNDQIKYVPTVKISTTFQNPPSGGRGVRIVVNDNGPGIPQNIVDKIFQPFFTTKPTGSGTGLGLSLSYDIVKAHGGEIKVESLAGEGSEFKITIPNT